jgi:hypothetical protein
MVRRCGLVLMVGIALSGACTESMTPSAMGNTNWNWLTLCSDDDDCDGAMTCSCGVCTRECSSSRECAGLSGSSCAQVSAQPSCDQMASVERVCLLRCAANADCGEGARCERGSCVGMAVQAAPDENAFMLTREDDVVSVPDVYKTCAQDADCMVVETLCSECCEETAIAIEHEARYQAEFGAVCADYVSTMWCNCRLEDLIPRCETGACVAVPGDALADVDEQQLGGAWVFTYATPPQGSFQALMSGPATVTGGCLLVDGAAVVWHEAQLPTIQQVIDAIEGGATPTVRLGGGGLSLDEGSTLDDFPSAIVSRCSPRVVWFASFDQVTVEGL